MSNNETLLKERILSVVTETYETPLEDIIRQVRKKEIVEPRQVIAYCLRLMTDMSFPAIGEILGGRDHTTIMHACRKIADKIEQNERFRERITSVLGAIRNPQDPADVIPETVEPAIEEPIADTNQYKIPTQNLELSEREKEILEKYRGGLTLKEISDAVGVTRERIRQIALKAMLKEVGAKIQEGFEIDVNEFLNGERITHDTARFAIPEEERQKLLGEYLSRAVNYTSLANFIKDNEVSMGKLTRSFPEVVAAIEQKNKEKRDRWSWYYPRCRGCGTTTIPHARKGYCEKCIGVYRGDRRESLLNEKSMCAVCSLDRASALQKYRKDLFITRDERVLCRGCFLQLTGSKLAESRSNRN